MCAIVQNLSFVRKSIFKTGVKDLDDRKSVCPGCFQKNNIKLTKNVYSQRLIVLFIVLPSLSSFFLKEISNSFGENYTAV